jgi:hypothetical protein
MQHITQIPEQYHAGLKDLHDESSEVFASIKDGINMASLTVSVKKLSNNVAAIKSLNASTVHKILKSAGSLFSFVEKGTEVDELIDNVISVLKDSPLDEEENIAFTEESEKVFKERLSFLINSDVIFYAYKGSLLLTEHQNVYIQAKAITDMRTIFSRDIESIPKAGVIVHNLHVHYSGDGEGPHKDIFISMDSDDIASLKSVLERAQKKEEHIRSLMRKSDITNLNE